jgi:hypothetical protein
MLWFAPNPGLSGRVLILLTFMFVNGTYLFVWRRLTPRWYDGLLSARLGVLLPEGEQRVLAGGLAID